MLGFVEPVIHGDIFAPDPSRKSRACWGNGEKNVLPCLALAHSGLVVEEMLEVSSVGSTGAGDCPWITSACHFSSMVSIRCARIFRIPRCKWRVCMGL